MTLNTYDSSKDPLHNVNDSGFARLGSTITPSDSVDFDTYVTLIVVVAGTVKFLPVINDTADPITMTLPVGFVIPWQVRRVFSTGTSATLRTLEKAF